MLQANLSRIGGRTDLVPVRMDRSMTKTARLPGADVSLGRPEAGNERASWKILP